MTVEFVHIHLRGDGPQGIDQHPFDQAAELIGIEGPIPKRLHRPGNGIAFRYNGYVEFCANIDTQFVEGDQALSPERTTGIRRVCMFTRLTVLKKGMAMVPPSRTTWRPPKPCLHQTDFVGGALVPPANQNDHDRD